MKQWANTKAQASMPQGSGCQWSTPKFEFQLNRITILVCRDNASLRGRNPRPVVGFRKRLELDVAAVHGIERNGLLFISILKRAYGDRISETDAVITDEKLIILDGAVIAFILARQISES